MSERGSFVTQWMDCRQCCEAVCEVLENEAVIFDPLNWSAGQIPPRIIAGFVGGSAPDEQFREFAEYLAGPLADRLCHPVRFAILSEARGSRVYRVRPRAAVPTGEDPCELLCRQDDTNKVNGQ